jgi:hypothetical protein
MAAEAAHPSMSIASVRPPLSHGGAFLRGSGRRFHEAFRFQTVLLFFGRL